MIINGTKRCPCCEKVLRLAAFYKNRSQPDGYSGWCAQCCADANRRWRAANRGLIEAQNAARRVKVARQAREKTCGGCGVLFVTPLGTQRRLCLECRTARETARAMARQRFDRGSPDVGAAEVARLKALAVRCPLCGCRMVDEIGHPAKKHLDHVVPVNVGGRHTLTNVRVICQSCNLARPKDGADVSQLVIA